MHDIYSFNFLKTISRQLKSSIDKLDSTLLTRESLHNLSVFQRENNANQGVYLILYDGKPVYLGKSDDVADRLGNHYKKLLGRQSIEAGRISYKAILLDRSMSTAANENILIKLFQSDNVEMWNGNGFGSKDPGKIRDNTKPGPFDTNHPINEKYRVDFGSTAGSLEFYLNKAKAELPYHFRFEIEQHIAQNTQIVLPEAILPAEEFLQIIVNSLGVGWKGVILKYGMVIYRTEQKYKHGKELTAIPV
jgi:hypothetical protein